MIHARPYQYFPDPIGPARQLQVYRVRVLHARVARHNTDVCACSPCADASKASMDCLNRNDYDRDACLAYFQAYRDCKSTWVSSGACVYHCTPLNACADQTTKGRPSCRPAHLMIPIPSCSLSIPRNRPPVVSRTRDILIPRLSLSIPRNRPPALFQRRATNSSALYYLAIELQKYRSAGPVTEIEAGEYALLKVRRSTRVHPTRQARSPAPCRARCRRPPSSRGPSLPPTSCRRAGCSPACPSSPRGCTPAPCPCRCPLRADVSPARAP